MNLMILYEFELNDKKTSQCVISIDNLYNNKLRCDNLLK